LIYADADQRLDDITERVTEVEDNKADLDASGKIPTAQLRSVALARLSNFRNLAPAAIRTAGPASALVSSPGLLGGTNRFFCPVIDVSQQVFYPVFTNSYGSTDQPGANAITVGCALESGSTIIPLTFNGDLKITLQPGGWAIPDTPPAIALTSVSYFSGSGTGTVTGFWLRTYVQITSGSYPVSGALNTVLVTGEVNGESSTGGTDLTAAGSSTVTAGNSGFAYGFGPQMILSRSKSHRLFAALGDSIINGQGDQPGSFGWIERAALSTGIPILKIGRSGSTALDFSTAAGRRIRGAQLDGVTDIIVAYGINDLGNNQHSAAQLQGYLTLIYAYLAGLGIRVHAATIGPRTISSDSFATTVNQTAITGTSNTITPATLTTINDWIRTVPTNVYAVIDQADSLMSARNSGLWKVDGTANKYTTDGTHPNAGGHQLLTGPLLASYLTAYRASTAW
jgi:lysophospholipase L1-like esterase